MSKPRLPVLPMLFILVIALVDQLIKIIVVNNIEPFSSVDFIGFGDFRILDLTYVVNDGAVFSILGGKRIFLVMMPIICSIGILYLIISRKLSRPVQVWTASAICGGAIGNLIDRIFRDGLVVDYLELKLFDFAIFNFADCFITVGVILFSVDYIFFDKGESVFGANPDAAVKTDAQPKDNADDA